jgi:N-methylhydantoinase A
VTARGRLGIDVGGTFTDLVAVLDGEVHTAKVPSTPDDQAQGAMAAWRAASLEADAIASFAHGMTIATNALLERRGARTALVTTEGFRDLVEIGRQSRVSLYDLAAPPPPALVPRELRFCVVERMGPDGELVALDESSVSKAVGEVAAAEVESVAVCLLHSFLHPAHEQRVAEALRAALPDVHVSLSSEVLPEFREYERFSTTLADAYLAPRLRGYLAALESAAALAGLPAPWVMQSSGGVVSAGDAVARAAGCVLSGPAGGVLGAAHVAAASGHRDVLTFDMGGTSTDVAAVVDGEPQSTTEAVIADTPIKLPMVDVHTVGAGGGSIAWADDGGALRVGPRSAGAQPGPAAYQRGGTEPAVTDANVVLGYLADDACLGGEVRLSRAAASAAVSDLARRLGLDELETAQGIVRVAEAEMARALRVISVERGLDPRDFAIVAFGGAGALHACALAEDLGVRTVLVPAAGGVLSALGLAISDLRRDYVAPLRGLLAELEGRRLERAWDELEARAAHDLPGGRVRRLIDLRYRGQSFELTVEADDAEGLAERYGQAHERRYGFRMDDEPIEAVAVRAIATIEVERPALPARPDSGPEAARTSRSIYLEGSWRDVDVVDGSQVGAGSTLHGPAVVELEGSTCLVRPAWRGTADAAGTIVLEPRG